MKKVAYYARVSTGRQEKEATIKSQVYEIEERIKEDGNIVSPEHIFIDDGWSGDMLARPALDKLRDSAEKKEFEILYLWDSDRLARRYSYQEYVKDEIQELGIEIIDLHTKKPENAEDKVLLGFKGLFAEYERVKIAERMRRGKMYKTRSGKLLGYQSCYGYDYIRKAGEKVGYFIINEEEAKNVRMIFALVGEQQYTIRKVIKKLVELKIYPRKQKRDFWVRSVIARMLKNESYIGLHYYNKTKSVVPKNPTNNNEKYKRIKKSSRKVRPKEQWIPYTEIPPIISQELFDKVQEQLKLNSKFCNRNTKHNYLVNGLVYCTCGYLRAGQTGGKQHYYRCTDRIYNFPLPPKCKEKGINAEAFDKAVWGKMIKFLNDEEAIKKQATDFIDSKINNNYIDNSQIEHLQNQLIKLNEEEQRYLKLYGSGLVGIDSLESQLKEVKNKKESLQIQINELELNNRKEKDYSLLNIDLMAKKAVSAIKTKLDFKEKKELLRNIVTRIVANQEFATISGEIPVESDNLNVSFEPIYRNRWSTKCRQINTF